MMDCQFAVSSASIYPSTDTIILGLERTDNNMELTSWPQVTMINQKNYYTCVTFFLSRQSLTLTNGCELTDGLCLHTLSCRR
jgi:hypothetical protein